MRVALCTFDGPHAISGVNTWMVRFVPRLAAAGIHVRVFVVLGGQPHAHEWWRTVTALKEAGIECECYMAERDPRNEVRELLRHLQLFRPDVFVPNCSGRAYYATRWVREAGVPTIGVIHCDSPFYTGGVMEQFVCGPADDRVSYLVCVSEGMRELFSCQAQDRVPVEYIPYGISMPDASELAQFPAPPAPFRVIYAGRMVEEHKRISEVARSLCRVVREVPGVEGLMYGDGHDRQRAVDVLAEEGAGLPVRYAGAYDGVTVYGHMRHAQATLLLSDNEGLPLTVLEAMACGLVPICLKIRSGLPELIETGGNGYLVEDRGPSVVAAVRELLADRGRWERMSAAARQTVATRFSLDACVSRWLDLFHRLVPAEGVARPIRIPWLIHVPAIHPTWSDWDIRHSDPWAVGRRLLTSARRFVGKIKSMRKVSPAN
jgi:glycosyltransferase involved in cell wall biosynthesis